jgi:hypothetical protein
MKLCYPIRKNGMYVLSREDIDEIVFMLLSEYQPESLEAARAVDVMSLMRDSLALSVKYKKIDFRDLILGITIFDEVERVNPKVAFQGDEGWIYSACKGLPGGTILINAILADKSNLRPGFRKPNDKCWRCLCPFQHSCRLPGESRDDQAF